MYLNTKFFFKIQKLFAFTFFLIGFIAILLNIIAPNPKSNQAFNISSILIITVIVGITGFINKKPLRLLQALLITSAGMLAIILDLKTRYIGDIVFIIGILLLYTYRFLNYSTLSIILTTLLMAAVRLSSLFIFQSSELLINIVVTLFSNALLLLTITVLGIEMQTFVYESQKHDLYSRAGENIFGFAHAFGVDKMVSYCERTIKYVIENNQTEAITNLNRLLRVLRNLYMVKEKILSAAKRSKKIQIEKVNIKEIIDNVIDLALFSRKVKDQIEFKVSVNENIFIHIAPYEIYLIIQNLITNAIESIFKKNENKQPESFPLELQAKSGICINASVDVNALHILFSDTGIGFATDRKKRVLIPGIIQNNDKTRGFGLFYVLTTIKKNQGKIYFSNKANEAGAEIQITLPLKRSNQNEKIHLDIN